MLWEVETCGYYEEREQEENDGVCLCNSSVSHRSFRNGPMNLFCWDVYSGGRIVVVAPNCLNTLVGYDRNQKHMTRTEYELLRRCQHVGRERDFELVSFALEPAQ